MNLHRAATLDALSTVVTLLNAERESIAPFLSQLLELRERVDDSPLGAAVADLNQALRRDERMAIFDGQMRAFASGWSHVDHFHLVHWLVKRALVEGAEVATAELDRYVTADKFLYDQRLIIGGIRIEKSVQVAEGIWLEPFNAWEEADKELIPGGEPDDSVAKEQMSAALVARREHPRRHRRAAENLETVAPESWDFSDLEDVMHCLTLIGPSAPAMIATSITAGPEVPVAGGPIGQLPRAAEIIRWAVLTPANLEDLREIYSAFQERGEPTKKVLRVSMRRLNMALHRRWGVDAALDFGVALEVLFSEGKPYDASTRFTLRLRAARFLRKSVVERRALAAAIDRLYKLRSSAAHAGELPKKKIDDVRPEQILEDSAPIVAEAIRSLIIRGIPDWAAFDYE